MTTICPVLMAVCTHSLGPPGGSIEAPWTWVFCPSSPGRCESHPMAGARAPLMAWGFRLRLPALCPRGSPWLHSSPSALQLHGIHWYAQISSRMSKCGGPRGHGLLWTLGWWAERLPHNPWSFISAVSAQSVSSTESCCPGLGPRRLTLRNTMTATVTWKAIPGSTVEVVERRKRAGREANSRCTPKQAVLWFPGPLIGGPLECRLSQSCPVWEAADQGLCLPLPTCHRPRALGQGASFPQHVHLLYHAGHKDPQVRRPGACSQTRLKYTRTRVLKRCGETPASAALGESMILESHCWVYYVLIF